MPLLLFLLAGPVAGAAPTVTVAAEIGFSGWVAPDVWIPLRLDITSAGAFEGFVDVEIPTGLPASAAAVYRRPLHLPAASRRRLTIPVIIADPRRPLIVAVHEASGDTVAQQRIALTHDQVVEGVVVAVTAEPAGLEFLGAAVRRVRGAYLHESDLPDHWAAYGGVDLLVLRDVDERAISEIQRQAVREWIAQGGRLLVTGDRLLQQRQPWLADLLPAGVSGAPALAPPGSLPAGMPAPLMVAVLHPKPGATASPARGLPMVVSRAYGRGRVTVWAFDAFAPAVRAWPGRLAFWDTVLAGRPTQPLARPDLAQVMPTTRSLPGGAQVQIITLAALYILAVRFALRRIAGRPGTWAVLAVVIVAFTVSLYLISSAARRSAATAVQVSVIEPTGAGTLARVTTYVAVVHPYGGSYVLTLPDGALVRALAPAPVRSTADNVVGGDTAPGVLLFEAAQMVPFPLQGRAAAGTDGLDVTIENRSGLPVVSPAVFLNGQTQMVPEITDRTVTTLLPARWARADRNAATGDFDRDARAWLVTRLDGYAAPAIIGYKTLWLMGSVRDARFLAQLRGAREQRSVVVLLSAIDVTGGR